MLVTARELYRLSVALLMMLSTCSIWIKKPILQRRLELLTTRHFTALQGNGLQSSRVGAHFSSDSIFDRKLKMSFDREYARRRDEPGKDQQSFRSRDTGRFGDSADRGPTRPYRPRGTEERGVEVKDTEKSQQFSGPSDRRRTNDYVPYDRSPQDYRRYRQEKKERSKDDFDGDHLYGITPVLLALRSRQRKFYELITQEGLDVSNKKDEQGAQEILDLATSLDVKRVEMSKHDMNLITDSRPHQGFILKSSAKELGIIKALPPVDAFQCVLALDEVWDPQNFGALIRTSHFLNVDKIVVCAKNSAPPSPVVSKSSAGALELTPIYSTQNLMKFLDDSIKNGWQVVGTALSRNTVKLKDLPLDKPTIVILGNEGHGIRTNILNRCTHLVRIGGNSESDVDSLNVSVTGGIILHHIMQSKQN